VDIQSHDGRENLADLSGDNIRHDTTRHEVGLPARYSGGAVISNWVILYCGVGY